MRVRADKTEPGFIPAGCCGGTQPQARPGKVSQCVPAHESLQWTCQATMMRASLLHCGGHAALKVQSARSAMHATVTWPAPDLPILLCAG